MVVGLLLAEVPREGVEPLREGTALVVGRAKAPLPERARAVARPLEDSAQGAFYRECVGKDSTGVQSALVDTITYREISKQRSKEF